MGFQVGIDSKENSKTFTLVQTMLHSVNNPDQLLKCSDATVRQTGPNLRTSRRTVKTGPTPRMPFLQSDQI